MAASFLNGNTSLSKNLQNWLTSHDVVKDKVVLDLGSGKGFLLQHCLDIGARFVFGIDHSLEAVEQAKKTVTDSRAHFAHLDISQHLEIIDLVKNVAKTDVEVILCNAAQIPLEKPLENGYFVGQDGREMLDEVLEFAALCLPLNAVLILTHSGLSDVGKTKEIAKGRNLKAEVMSDSHHKFTFYEELRTEHICSYLRKRGLPLGEDDQVDGCIVSITWND